MRVEEEEMKGEEEGTRVEEGEMRVEEGERITEIEEMQDQVPHQVGLSQGGVMREGTDQGGRKGAEETQAHALVVEE